MGLKLTSEEKNRLMNEIQNFFLNERDEQMGIIATESVLDFFLADLGKAVYNKALDDARLWMTKKLEDIEVDYDVLYK